jgi:hypothetical protein
MMTHLPEVKLSILLRCNTLNLDEGGVGSAVTLGALVTKNTTLGVQSEMEFNMPIIEG